MIPPLVHDQVRAVEQRLKQLMSDMHDIWNSSINDLDPAGPMDLYAVDTDIAYMFMSPGEDHHYGALLRYEISARRDEDEELDLLETKLVEFLGNLIFFQLQPQCGMVLFADHAIELQRIVTSIGDDALALFSTWTAVSDQLSDTNKRITDISTDKLHRAATILKNTDGHGAGEAPNIQMLLEQIHKSLRGDGHVGKLFRFDQLVTGERLTNIESLPIVHADGRPSALPSPVGPDGKYYPAMGRLASRLLKRMNQLSSKAQARTVNIASDATVLAHLAWLNEQLAQDDYYIHVGKHIRPVRRIILISGSQLLARAIQDLELTQLERCVFSPLSVLGHRRMDEYVRIGDSEIQDIPDCAVGMSSSSLINFLDSMRQTLSRAISDQDYDRLDIAMKRVRNEHRHLVESWQGRQLFDDETQPASVSSAIDELQKRNVTLTELQNFMHTLAVRAWQAFARSVTILGFRKADNSVIGVVQRNIPPLRLPQYPMATRMLDDLLAFAYARGCGSEAEAPLTKATILPVTNEDPSHFTEFLCYAQWALAHRLFKSAAGCAELALSIVEDDANAKNLITERREARYLLAHLIKLRAKTRSDLVRAHMNMQWIVEEIRRQDGADDERVTAECFSIVCHQWYFQAFRIDRNETGQGPEKLLEHLKQAFLSGRALLEGLPVPTLKSSYASVYARQQILVNLVQIALLCKFGLSFTADRSLTVYMRMDEGGLVAGMDDEFKLAATELLTQYKFLDTCRTSALPRPSLLCASVCTVAAMVWFQDELGDFPVEFQTTQWSVLDIKRFQFLENVLQYCITARGPGRTVARAAIPA